MKVFSLGNTYSFLGKLTTLCDRTNFKEMITKGVYKSSTLFSSCSRCRRCWSQI